MKGIHVCKFIIAIIRGDLETFWKQLDGKEKGNFCLKTGQSRKLRLTF